MKLLARLVVAVLLATPAAALAAPGVITASVNLRAGPSVEFPVVDRMPRGVAVEVHGCIREALWCDVSWERERGWVAAQYLGYLYGGRYVDLPSYVDVAEVPAASFVLGSYWSSFYIGRPWYRRHAWWTRHWHTQTQVASQAPAVQPPVNGMMPAGAVKPPAGMVKPAAGMVQPPAGIAMGRAPTAVPAVGSGQATSMQAMRGTRPAMTSGATAPANAMRGGGMPMAAHAQVGGSRGGGGMPHAAMGGAPQIGGAMHGAMHNGGGGRDGGGGGHHRH